MNTLQAEHDEKRKQYLAGKLTHAEFYGWLGEKIKLNPSDVPFTVEQIKASTGTALNDLRLSAWDGKNQAIRAKASAAGMKSWSLSDTVCVLKCYARKLAA